MYEKLLTIEHTFDIIMKIERKFGLEKYNFYLYWQYE